MFKEENLKITFNRLGEKFNLPREIIIYLYNILLNINNGIINTTRWYNQTNIFRKMMINKEFCPENRGLEWAIKSNKDQEREDLLMDIKVIGIEGYLFMQRASGEVYGAGRKNKIKYLNTSCKEEVIEDYTNFLIWRGTINEHLWRIVIDEFGDSRFI